MDESNEAPKHILALSWNIATNPKLYWKLAPNPYSSRALQIISELFPDSSVTDIIKAVVLAEPEGKYDSNFKQSPKAQQEEELSKQADLATRINKRLVQYYKKHAKELSRLSKETIYRCLSKVIFEISDLKEIEQIYSQNQRRSFRLSIINYIEDAQRFKRYRRQEYPGRTGLLLKAVFAFLSVILLFYTTNSLYELQVEQRQTGSKYQILAAEAQKENQMFPARLIIPSIGVDAAIEHVGIASKGEMEVPSNSVDVGWFKFGSPPGEKGSAVISGHIDGENGDSGVFANLYKLKTGDKLYVKDDEGRTISFVVRKSRIYNPGYAEEVFSSNDGAHLNLVTCDGVWDGTKKSYIKRLVIFTDVIN